MEETHEALLTSMVRSLTEYPDQVVVKTMQSQGSTIFSIDVYPTDFAKIIGRNGTVVNSVKTFFNALGGKAGKRYIVEVIG